MLRKQAHVMPHAQEVLSLGYAKSLFSLKYLQPASAASDVHLPVHSREGVAAAHVSFDACGGSVGESHPLSLQQ